MNSLLRFRLAVDAADVGELGPLQVLPSVVVVGAVGAASAEKPLVDGSGMASTGRSVCVMRARGTGPAVGATVGAGPWNAGRGSEGMVCLGLPRAGRGPTWRRRGVGG